ncbi:hypothetical protein AB0F88_42095, partial [Streptosporangium sp. NPDC023963]|uniref:hypothetical protein n=1 Tax=Streptosporangium sp. NPDC023963 TaxID=3155608 RepID=UPI0034259283
MRSLLSAVLRRAGVSRPAGVPGAGAFLPARAGRSGASLLAGALTALVALGCVVATPRAAGAVVAPVGLG